MPFKPLYIAKLRYLESGHPTPASKIAAGFRMPSPKPACAFRYAPSSRSMCPADVEILNFRCIRRPAWQRADIYAYSARRFASGRNVPYCVSTSSNTRSWAHSMTASAKASDFTAMIASTSPHIA